MSNVHILNNLKSTFFKRTRILAVRIVEICKMCRKKFDHMQTNINIAIAFNEAYERLPSIMDFPVSIIYMDTETYGLLL